MAQQLQTRAVDRAQPDRPGVGGPVPLVDVVEDLLVAGLPAERLHGPDAAQRLGEVHDHQRHRLPGGPVGLLGLAPEPNGKREYDRQ